MKPTNRFSLFVDKRRNASRSGSWRRRLFILCLVAALGSLVVLSSVSLAERAGTNKSNADKRPQPKPSALLAALRQEESLPSMAKPVDVASVKPSIFHGDVRRIPLVKEKIKKPRPEPKEPPEELQQTSGPDSALQPFAPAAPAPTPSAAFPGLDFANWGNGWPPDTNGDVGP